MQHEIVPHRVQVEINLTTLCANYHAIRGSVSPCDVMPVLKANAYGLGVEPIACALVGAGAKRLAVAEPYEALQLISLGVPVQILSTILPDEIDPMLKADVILPMVSYEVAEAISRRAVALKCIATLHCKIDTGMGRAGMLWYEAVDQIRRTAKLPNLRLEGIFTHFPLGYEVGADFTHIQLDRFKAILAEVAQDGITFDMIHAANSDGINNVPDACQAPFNWVRSGINLHGSFDVAGRLRVPLKPVLHMTTRIAQIRVLPEGTPIGYGHTYATCRSLRTATISAGYADGLPLALSNRGTVLIHGKQAPILGRISMDYTVVSLEDIPEAQVGDTVTLLGRDGDAAIHVKDWADIKGTHAYDIICSIGNRVERTYTYD